MESLTSRELEVARLLVMGYSNSQIADALSIAFSTAKAHVASILEKLGVKNRVQAAVIAASFLDVTPEEVMEAARIFDAQDEG